MSRNPMKMLVVLGVVLLFSSGALWAQGQQSFLYNNFPTGQPQSVNIPAGVAVTPATELLYIVDTGANLRGNQLGGDADLGGFNSPMNVVDQGDGRINPYGAGGTLDIYQADGVNVDREKINRNFIAITNTHPTQAVTVHFRYFNDECNDVLDFLIVLTCNDTLIFDPFNFIIPESGGLNAGNKIFGPSQFGDLFKPIPAVDFGSGRFLIFATAAGTSTNTDDLAEFRFPAEFDGLQGKDDCDNIEDDTYFGTERGLVDDNLHVFNSSAVVFNYLIGHMTTAVPFGDVFQAYGVNAWGRPAVSLMDQFGTSIRGFPSGDGPAVVDSADNYPPGPTKFTIVTGREDVLDASQTIVVTQNNLFLRNEVHGGDSGFNIDAGGDLIWDSWYGAIAWTSLVGPANAVPDQFGGNQAMHFLSAVDDYNGSQHSGDSPVGGFVDRSYNLAGAKTAYVLQIYNNDEEIYDLKKETPINVSPPPFDQPTAVLKILVDCLRVYVGTDTSTAASLAVQELQISDLLKIFAGDADNPSIPAFLNTRVDTNDASHGWIRFVRCNGLDAQGNPNGPPWGTWVEQDFVNSPFDAGTNDQTLQASFVTIAMNTVRAGGFGAAWWAPAAASDPAVSTSGDPTP